jgi:hypothetical protein
MKRAFLYPFIIIIAVSMACIVPTGKKDTPTPVPTEVIEEPTQEVIVEPTEAPIPTEAPLPTEAAVEESPTPEQAGGLPFTEEFDLPNKDWSDPLTVTTQALTGQVFSKITVSDGFLRYQLKDKETYIYQFYLSPQPADVAMEIKFTNNGNALNGIAMVCRATDDYSSWYEFRVSNSWKYDIYKYDKALRVENKNPYVALKQGVAGNGMIKPVGDNVITASCKGPTLTMTFNGKQTVSVMNNDITDGGLIGLGAMSGPSLPVNIYFDYFKASEP